MPKALTLAVGRYAFSRRWEIYDAVQSATAHLEPLADMTEDRLLKEGEVVVLVQVRMPKGEQIPEAVTVLRPVEMPYGGGRRDA